MGRVLVACEYSGTVRRAFAALGHDAWSCDLLPSEDRSNKHIVGDVRDILDDGWDLMAVMHPPCTVLCYSGVKHLYIGGRRENGRYEPRWQALDEAAAFYRALRNAPIPRKAIENPIMHRYAVHLTGRGSVQYIQPWQFGHPVFKKTGLELIGLPQLKSTNRLTPPRYGTEEYKRWSSIFRAAPGPDRWKDRSRTFDGIAAAMADQWGRELPKPDQLDLFKGAA